MRVKLLFMPITFNGYKQQLNLGQKEETNMPRVTKEDLVRDSLKQRLKEQRLKYRQGDGQYPDSFIRHPDTVRGFLTKEQVAQMFLKVDENRHQMLIGEGLAIISNEVVFFLADDPSFAANFLPEGFIATTLTALHFVFGPGRRYEDMDEILNKYCDGETHLNSIEELVDFINRNNGYGLNA